MTTDIQQIESQKQDDSSFEGQIFKNPFQRLTADGNQTSSKLTMEIAPPPPATTEVETANLDVEEDTIAKPPASPVKMNGKESQAELMIKSAKELATFFHTPDGEVFASMKVNGHIENVRIRSRAFRRWLSRSHYQETGKPAGAQAIKDTVAILEAEGLYDGEEQELHIRYAWHEGAIYIDLGNADWHQVRIRSGEWGVIEGRESPVKFIRTPGMREMAAPVLGGSIDALRPLLNIENDSDWVLIVSWLIGAMSPKGPFPVLVLQGEQGTAKSTTARILRNLLDPSTIPSQALPKGEQDLVIVASGTWILNFDNLSYLRPEMSDALCRLSTGGGFRTRALYTDDGERMFHAMRPMIMNGITDIATRHDLADRSLIIQLPVIPKDKRRSEKDLQQRWDEVRGLVFGALCSAVAGAIAHIETTKLDSLPRMADFATWVTAAENALEWEKGVFLREYDANRKRLISISMDADPIAITIIRLIQRHKGHQWSGSATELHRMLSTLNQDFSNQRAWPRQPNVLSGRLRRAAAGLRELGIEIEWTKSGNRTIHISRNGNYTPGALDHIVPENQSPEKLEGV